jgi:hypothetical protein
VATQAGVPCGSSIRSFCEFSVADLERRNPSRARAVHLDVTDLAQVKASVQAAVDAFNGGALLRTTLLSAFTPMDRVAASFI